MPLSPSTPVGAFTNVTVAAINAALAQAGFSTTGNVFYCDPVNGLDTNDGQTSNAVPLSGGHGPVQSLGAGYALLRNGFNDVLVLIGNGQSSGSARLAAGFTWAKNAAHLIGICAPSAVSQRARIALPTGAGQAVITANFFTVSGNGCMFSNLSWFQGAGAGQTGIAAAILMTITGSRNAFINCDFEGMGDATSAADAGSRSMLISAGGQENYFKHCNLGLDTVQRTNANSSVEIAGGGPETSSKTAPFPSILPMACSTCCWPQMQRRSIAGCCSRVATSSSRSARVRCDRATIPLGRIGRRDSARMDAQTASYGDTVYGGDQTHSDLYGRCGWHHH